MNPFGVVPVYLVMTQEMDRERRHRALGSTAIALLTVLLSALLIGKRWRSSSWRPACATSSRA